MQKYLSIDNEQKCNKTVKFPNTENEFCGTIKFNKDGELKNLSDIVPSEANVDNKLVDRKTMEQEIEIADAKFIGTFESEDELPTTGVDKNDYAFVKTTEQEKVVYNKYKWTKTGDTTWGWKFEYPIETGVSGIFVKLEDMKKYANEAIDSLNDDDSDISIEGILKQFFNHFISDENAKIK